MTEPIRLFAVVDPGPVRDVATGPFQSPLVFDDRETAEHLACDCSCGFSVIELTEVRRCGTCCHRQPDTEEDDTTLGGDTFMGCAIFPDYPDAEFLKRVADGTGHCHMHEEKTDG